MPHVAKFNQMVNATGGYLVSAHRSIVENKRESQVELSGVDTYVYTSDVVSRRECP